MTDTKSSTPTLSNDEEFGVWGGMTRAERLASLPAWKAIKAARGIPPRPAGHEAQSHGPYLRRVARAQACLPQLRSLPADWAVTNPQYGTHYRDEFIALFELVVRYPERSHKELGAGLDRSATWFADMTRNCRVKLGVE